MTIVEVKSEASQNPAAGIDATPPPTSDATKTGGAAAGTAHTVVEIVAGVQDGGGEKIDGVYFKRKDYAIYRRGTPSQVKRTIGHRLPTRSGSAWKSR